ncbi:MAG: hypothetical protein WBM17_16315, partial [Anaerolineales bacterium]
MPASPVWTRRLSVAPILTFLFLFSVACGISGSPQASPTPTATRNPTSTSTPTAIPTFTPIPNPEGLLTSDQRSGYTVILRSSDDAVHERLYAISGYLQDRGYVTDIDSYQSDIGDMDIILYGAPSCNDAIDDLTVILEGRLDITGLERSRFIPEDAMYDWKY